MEKPKNLKPFSRQMHETKAKPQLTNLKTDLMGLNISEERANLSKNIVEGYLQDVRDRLSEDYYFTRIRLVQIAKMLDKAQSISNDPRIADLRSQVEKKYGRRVEKRRI